MGDSPARYRVPVAGTVSVSGVVAVSHGRLRRTHRGRRVQGKSSESDQGQASSRIGHRSSPLKGVGREPMRWLWSWEKGDGGPQGVRAEGVGRAGYPRWRLLPGGSLRPFKQAQPRSLRVAEARGGRAFQFGIAPRVRVKPSPRASAPAGCAERPACRSSSAAQGPPRPQASRRLRWEPARRPGPRPGRRASRRAPPKRRLTRSVHSA